MDIILADDDRDVLKSLRNFLEARNHTLRCASDGIEARALLQDALPDLVITDIHMPHMDGIALLETIRKSHPALPVILITAYDDVDLEAVSERFDATICFKKPVPLAPLLSILNQL